MTPFKDKTSLLRQINGFLKRHRTYVAKQAKRINQYFEMSAYNSVVQFYENNGYKVRVRNLLNGSFRYKLSPTGYPSRFSYFEIRRVYKLRGGNRRVHRFEVHHNLAVESSIEKGIYVSPDISVISKDSIQELKDPRYFFTGHRAYYYVGADSLQTFCEVKNFNPFPALLFNFMGLVSEITNDVFCGHQPRALPKHIAPSLMLSGNGNYHTRKIRKSLTERYPINIFFGLFFRAAQPYSSYYSRNVTKIGSRHKP